MHYDAFPQRRSEKADDAIMDQKNPGNEPQQEKTYPGQPFGNMENNRCKRNLDSKLRRCVVAGESPRTVAGIRLFRRVTARGGYSSMMPRFRPIVTAWVWSLAPSLERIFLTCPLTVSSSGNANKLIADQLSITEPEPAAQSLPHIWTMSFH